MEGFPCPSLPPSTWQWFPQTRLSLAWPCHSRRISSRIGQRKCALHVGWRPRVWMWRPRYHVQPPCKAWQPLCKGVCWQILPSSHCPMGSINASSFRPLAQRPCGWGGCLGSQEAEGRKYHQRRCRISCFLHFLQPLTEAQWFCFGDLHQCKYFHVQVVLELLAWLSCIMMILLQHMQFPEDVLFHSFRTMNKTVVEAMLPEPEWKTVNLHEPLDGEQPIKFHYVSILAEIKRMLGNPAYSGKMYTSFEYGAMR